jgi:hypothetical protein
MHNILLFFTVLFGVSILALVFYYYYSLNRAKLNKKKTERSNNAECRKANRIIQKRNQTDFLWADFNRVKTFLGFFILFAIFFVLLTLVSTSTSGQLFGIIGFLVTVGLSIYAGLFAYKSYHAFEAKAKARLTAFETKIQEGIEKEISFDGDNIQHFSNIDDEFDTKPEIFSFPVEVTKIDFPPFEKNAGKKPIISTRKLEFLVLSREYFSICQGASKFNLLQPAQAGVPKKCIETAGGTGECHEYYYSQMQNVQYDNKEECIRIIYYGDIPDVTFACKKAAANRKPAMKALKEKLRLTERQKLNKIQEHKSYEDIKNKRETHTTTEDKED